MARRTEPKGKGREIIQANEEILPGTVVPAEKATDKMKVLAAAIIAAASLIMGSAFLSAALYLGDKELRAWATGLISLVVGAAIGFIFGGNSNGKL